MFLHNQCFPAFQIFQRDVKECSTMLEIYIHLLWIILFGLNLLATIVINCTILSYLKEKPLGRQTLFDLMVCDMILVLLLTICFYTFSKLLIQIEIRRISSETKNIQRFSFSSRLYQRTDCVFTRTGVSPIRNILSGDFHP